MMSTYNVNPNIKETQVVGHLPQKVLDKYNLNCSSNEVKMFPGAIKHIKKKHAEIFSKYHSDIPNIISNPDYVGQNPKEPNSIELYKFLTDHLLVAIKLDPSGYLYLSSFYDLHNGSDKIEKRLRTGRIVPFSSI